MAKTPIQTPNPAPAGAGNEPALPTATTVAATAGAAEPGSPDPVVTSLPAGPDTITTAVPATGSETTTTDPATPAAPQERKKDWRDDRIAKLTGKLKELNERQPAPAAPVTASPANAPALDPTADFNARVAAEAQKYAGALVQQHEFDRRCTDEATKGRKQWADFDDRLNDLRTLVNTADENEVAQYNAFLQAGLETGELALLVYELGQDLDEANKIMQLPPLKMGVELTKRALKGAQIDEVSKVPKPVTPLTGGRGEQVPIDPTNPELADNLTTSEWMKRREKQIAERSAR